LLDATPATLVVLCTAAPPLLDATPASLVAVGVGVGTQVDQVVRTVRPGRADQVAAVAVGQPLQRVADADQVVAARSSTPPRAPTWPGVLVIKESN
jgi:hypothetical protein